MFNIIPQQDLYDPWGRPGAGAPLVHPPTGQKFTRYSGSLDDKLVTTSHSLHYLNYIHSIEYIGSIRFSSTTIQWKY